MSDSLEGGMEENRCAVNGSNLSTSVYAAALMARNPGCLKELALNTLGWFFSMILIIGVDDDRVVEASSFA